MAYNEEIHFLIWDAHVRTGLNGDKLLNFLAEWKGLDGEDLPDRSTVYRTIERFKRYYQKNDDQLMLDQPWQLRPYEAIGTTLSGSSVDNVSVLLEASKAITKFPEYPGDVLTIRLARWVTLLSRVMVSANLGLVIGLSKVYAIRERITSFFGRQFDTTDLDALVSFGLWESSANAITYYTAVELGYIPELELDRGIDDILAAIPSEQSSGSPSLAILQDMRDPDLRRRLSQIAESIPEELREAFGMRLHNVWKSRPDLATKKKIKETELMATQIQLMSQTLTESGLPQILQWTNSPKM